MTNEEIIRSFAATEPTLSGPRGVLCIYCDVYIYPHKNDCPWQIAVDKVNKWDAISKVDSELNDMLAEAVRLWNSGDRPKRILLATRKNKVPGYNLYLIKEDDSE